MIDEIIARHDQKVKNNRKAVVRKHFLKKKYALTTAEYDAMLDSQQGVCAICGKPEASKLNGVAISLHVDHDHTTGKVRGLLCSKCNPMLGYAQDDIKILQSAIRYLSQ